MPFLFRAMIALTVVIFLSVCSMQSNPATGPIVYNFEECVAAGYAVLKSDPPQCSTPDGRVFTGIRGYSDKVIAQRNSAPVSSYEECVALGYAVLKTLPPQCVTPQGERFVQGQPARQKPENAVLCKDLCGNGSCEQIVCMAQGCPCAESQASCPKDCR